MAMIIEPSLTYKPSFRKDKLIPNFFDLKFQYFPIPLYRALFFNQTYIINKVKKKNWPRPSNPLKLYLKNFGVRSIIKIKIDLIAKFKNFYILFFFLQVVILPCICFRAQWIKPCLFPECCRWSVLTCMYSIHVSSI